MSRRLQHTINFTGGVGVLARESPIGSPTPGDPVTIRFVAIDTQTPYTLDFDGADGGKNAHHLLRWVNPAGQKGPWSEAATVGA